MTAGTLRLALVGAPNSGKTTLFNGLTGGIAKTANYAGTTVETRNGKFETPGGASITLVDLPGIYGLEARSLDERVAVEAIQGKRGDGSVVGLSLTLGLCGAEGRHVEVPGLLHLCPIQVVQRPVLVLHEDQLCPQAWAPEIHHLLALYRRPAGHAALWVVL